MTVKASSVQETLPLFFTKRKKRDKLTQACLAGLNNPTLQLASFSGEKGIGLICDYLFVGRIFEGIDRILKFNYKCTW